MRLTLSSDIVHFLPPAGISACRGPFFEGYVSGIVGQNKPFLQKAACYGLRLRGLYGRDWVKRRNIGDIVA